MQNHLINIALVGCGRISEKHLTSIFSLQNRMILKAICDNDNEKLMKTKKFISDLPQSNINLMDGIQTFNDYEVLLNQISLNKLNIDLLVLCTPSGLHADQCIKAGNLGINVITEKPLATSLIDGYEILNCFKKSEANLFVVLQNRLNPTVSLVKKQIDNGRFGKIYLLTSNVFWQRPQIYYDQAKWRGTKKLDGGAMLNQSSHYVDLMCFLPNLKIKKVSSFANTLGRHIEMEDTAVLNLEYENGAVGNLSVTMLTHPKNIEGSITILGENGTVKIGGIALNKIETWEFKDDNKDDELVDGANYEIQSVYGSGHLPFYKEVIDVLNKKNINGFSYQQGLLSLNVIMSAYESIKEKKVIFL